MVAFNFSAEFAGPVERREKVQTIRQTRREQWRTARERNVERFEMTRIALPGIDERRHAAGEEPRPVSGAGDRTGIERMDRNRVHEGRVARVVRGASSARIIRASATVR